ncbi:MAG TPA: hypothetical protein PLP34_06415 [Chitinophagaceae bacterium]|nr:hypothetical protein [Chitinophagaceae bacterium]HNF72025.1 hypothetical protein [Chitinophagaceae bacterium]
MKKIVLGIGICMLAGACQKVTEITIYNDNEEAITLTVKTDSLMQVYSGIPAHQKQVFEYNWTRLRDTEGVWEFVVHHLQSGIRDTFRHGYFSHGELNSFVEIHSLNSELKVRISE